MMKRFLLLAATAVMIACAGCGRKPVLKNADSPNRGIVCFGNSLTAGHGAEEGTDYPSVLRSMVTDEPIFNAGISGETSADGLARLEAATAIRRTGSNDQ